ncbi:ABC transporter permease [Amycolatopsis sp. cmx-11-51]|uniref:ABC transporter permease n=1 Tax=Amycolatopsis sp. cmx-11-51 TaxID=2785797 RepID=UPI0039E5F244
MAADSPWRHSLKIRLLGGTILVAICSITATAWLSVQGTAGSIQQERGQELATDAHIYDTLLGYAATQPNRDAAGPVLAARTDPLPVIGAKIGSGTFLDQATGSFPAAVLGDKAATRLGITELRPGEPKPQVWLGDQWFVVVGILDAIPLAPDVERAVLVGWDAARTRLGFDGHPTVV